MRAGEPGGAGAAGGARAEGGDLAPRGSRHVDHAAFERVLGRWCTAQGMAPDEARAVEGKSRRGLHGAQMPGVHLVAAYAHQPRLVLAEAETVGNGHERAVVQVVLAALPALFLAGRVGTGDAWLATRALCHQIVLIVRNGGTRSSS